MLSNYILLVCSLFLSSSGILLIVEGWNTISKTTDASTDAYIPPPIAPDIFEPVDTCTCDHGLVSADQSSCGYDCVNCPIRNCEGCKTKNIKSCNCIQR
jgi:hypothetical protein